MRKFKGLLGILLPALMIVSILSYGVRKDILENRFSNVYFRGEVGTWGYLADDVYNCIKAAVPISPEKMQGYINEFVEGREIVPYSAFEGNEEVKNVILIQMEGIDAITLGLKIQEEFVMPNLRELSEKCFYLTNVYDQTGSGRTSDGEFLALTSILPVENESMYIKYTLENMVSLPKLLADKGYKTISIHGYEGSFYNRKIRHAELGFCESLFLEDLRPEAEEADYLGWGLSDKYVLDKALELVKDEPGKLFAHIILLTNHHPFDAVTGHYEDVIFKTPESIVENYLNSVHYTDAILGEFIKQLEESKELEDSVIVLFSDHDSGITGQLYEYFGLAYDEMNKDCDKVPMLLYDGNVCHKEDMVSGQADIMPLLLSYMGMEIPKNSMGLNYVDGQKVVYKQGVTIYEETGIMPEMLNLEELTKSIVNYKGDE